MKNRLKLMCAKDIKEDKSVPTNLMSDDNSNESIADEKMQLLQEENTIKELLKNIPDETLLKMRKEDTSFSKRIKKEKVFSYLAKTIKEILKFTEQKPKENQKKEMLES